MDKMDKAALAAIGTSTALTGGGSVTVAVITKTFLGITVGTTTVALPVAGIVATVGLATWGGYRVWRWMNKSD